MKLAVLMITASSLLGQGLLEPSGAWNSPLRVVAQNSSTAVAASSLVGSTELTANNTFTWTLAQAGTTGFEAAKWFVANNIGSGTLTITTTTSTFNGCGYSGSSLAINAGQSARLTSSGGNWVVDGCGGNGAGFCPAGVCNSTGSAWGTSYAVGNSANNLFQFGAGGATGTCGPGAMLVCDTVGGALRIYGNSGVLPQLGNANVFTGTNSFVATSPPTLLGVGTSSPGATIDVLPSGDTTHIFIGDLGCGTTQVGLATGTSAPGSCGNYMIIGDNNGATFLNAASGQAIKFRMGNGDHGILNSSAQWGMETTTPGTRLQVNGGFCVTNGSSACSDPGAGNMTVSGVITPTKGVILPTSCTGLASGTLYNNAGTPAICP